MYYLKFTKANGWSSLYEMFTKEQVNWLKVALVGEGIDENQIEIGENSIIGAGAVVSKSIPSNCTAVGVPAKPTKFHND